MRFRRLTSALLAGPKEDVAAATLKWAQTLGQNDPDKVENQSKVLLVTGNNILNEGASIGCIHRSFHEEAHHIAKA